MTLIERARTEYERLLRLKYDTWERHHNQSYMAFLRDFIAETEGRSSESVQTGYETAAELERDRG